MRQRFGSRPAYEIIREEPNGNTYCFNTFVSATVVLSLILSALAIYYTDTTFFRTLTQFLLQTKEIIVFTVTAFVLVQRGDRWLVKKPR